MSRPGFSRPRPKDHLADSTGEGGNFAFRLTTVIGPARLLAAALTVSAVLVVLATVLVGWATVGIP
ncbi:hypothetical protein SAMN04489716_2772 [Actinoplanes derwentensis]|uniref:Uncharacterized protein n=1 Tax=Actinoplanes derwentensis TaxID=113562 RepID=A0A1H1YAM3_9ACTN|nr:hypothetical protein Ade03nite_91860 [Actinoplanes derwentensis]SDT18309.1 hypothetical protein SAMN04489716_2772 [Actinoplanes derwentensis]